MDLAQHPSRAHDAVLVLRTRVTPSGLAGLARRRLQALDPDVPLEISTMDRLVGDSISDRRFTMLVLVGFGALAVVLAAVGIYGIVSYAVARRTREAGIRLALGASPRGVRALVQRGTLRTVLVGGAVGLAGSLLLGRLLAGLLVDVKPTDPLTLAGATVVLGIVAWLATYVPARRMTRVDPVITMRAE